MFYFVVWLSIITKVLIETRVKIFYCFLWPLLVQLANQIAYPVTFTHNISVPKHYYSSYLLRFIEDLLKFGLLFNLIFKKLITGIKEMCSIHKSFIVSIFSKFFALQELNDKILPISLKNAFILDHEWIAQYIFLVVSKLVTVSIF